MNGLLDDPRQAGLLSLGLRLMSTPGKFGTALGQAGLGAMGDMQQAAAAQDAKKTLALQEQMLMLQLEQAKRQQADAQARKQAAQGAMIPGMPAHGMALGDGEGDVQIPATPERFDPMLYGRNLIKQLGDPSALMAMMPKPKGREVVAPNASVYDHELGRAVYTAPDKPEKKDIGAMIIDGPNGPIVNPLWVQAKNATKQAPVQVNVGDKSFGNAFAADAAKALGESRDAAKASSNTLQTLARMQSALDGGAIVGPGSTFRTFGMQLGQMIGVGGKTAEEQLSNTRKILQGSAQLNLDGSKAMQGQGQVSNFERQMVEKAAGGGVDTMTEPEIRTLIGVLHKLNTARITDHQGMLDKVDPKYQEFTPFYRVDMPNTDGWSIRKK